MSTNITNYKLGDILVYAGKISFKQLELAMEEQKQTSDKLGEILIEKGWVTENEVVEALERQLGFQSVDLSKHQIDLDIVTTIPESIARKYNIIPIGIEDGKLIVAMDNPLNIIAKDDVKLYTKKEIIPVIARKSDIINLIDRYFSSKSTKEVLEEFDIGEISFGYNELDTEEVAEVTSAPIVRLLNSIIEQAARSKASDIHIEPYSEEIRVRIRVDGDLRSIMSLPRNNLSPIITRIKIIGKMNIAEKRVPQDGRVETKIGGRDIDLRISTLPTVYGEKAVIRLLNKDTLSFTKESLGFTKRNLDLFNRILHQPYGMILVTGPTGSGKTTTLYTALKDINTIDKNIITVEDPVEYRLGGVNQVQVNVKSGLTFASGLRSILRQDPDIIMIGEIRDGETAEIAVRAAITGHLVLSTLHTNDSPSSIARLIDMGVESYLVSSAVIGIMSQRLVKLLCPECKEAYEISEKDRRILNLNNDEEVIIYKPKGCNTCNQGYKGRKAVHELMAIDDELRKLIDINANVDEIRNSAVKSGMTTLTQGVINLAIQGETSIEEVLRVGFTL